MVGDWTQVFQSFCFSFELSSILEIDFRNWNSMAFTIKELIERLCGIYLKSAKS